MTNDEDLKLTDITWLVPRPQKNGDKSRSDSPNPPKKGYWIAHIDVADPHRYALYGDVYDDVFTLYGARYVVRGGQQLVFEGVVKSRTVVVEFESLSIAIDCYKSFEGQQAKALRTAFSIGDLVIVEGFADE